MKIMQYSFKKQLIMFNSLLVLLLISPQQYSIASEKIDVIDKVLAVVNESVITQSEFNRRQKEVLNNLTPEQKAAMPVDFKAQLLDAMITDRIQFDEADRRKLSVSDEELNAAVDSYAAQQNMNLTQFSNSLLTKGETLKGFKQAIKESITISRLSEYYAHAKVVVPDYEIDGFIAANNLQDNNLEFEVAHIFLSKNDSTKLENVEQGIRIGTDFNELAKQYSIAGDASQGGYMGWKKSSELPDVFQGQMKNLKEGEVSKKLESENGFHFIKLMRLKGQRTEIDQYKVRHILISAEKEIAKKQAFKKMDKILQEIKAGSDFDQMARIYSEDSVSAANGGALGWVSNGEMVKEFEEMYKKTPINEISPAFATQFGIHILQVQDKRIKNVTDLMVRQRVRNILRKQRADREYSQWLLELKDQAYVLKIADPQ